jgi:hypothetical protein
MFTSYSVPSVCQYDNSIQTNQNVIFNGFDSALIVHDSLTYVAIISL